MLYFACLGAGYIMVEVGLIAHFVMALGNPTISASMLITGMLVFSGLGALTSERILPRMRKHHAARCSSPSAALLIAYALFINPALDAIGALPYGARLVCCFVFDRAAGVLDGLPDADRDDDARATRQGAHVHLGVGRQRLLLGDRGGRGARCSRPTSASAQSSRSRRSPTYWRCPHFLA